MTPEETDTIRTITREEIAAATHRLIDAIRTGTAELRAEIQAAEDRAQEFARGIETNLLTAFHGHAKGQTARLHTAEVTTHDIGIRMAALEERMLNLETRRPPQ